jgi:acyl-CoA reductase-like NAD-dependent aldehyde dehydrogenase
MTPPQSIPGAGLIPVVPLWINGTEQTASYVVDVVSAGNSQACWRATSATTDDARRAVESAQTVFPGWSETKPNIRRDLLLKTADLLEARTKNMQVLCKWRWEQNLGLPHFLSCLWLSRC